MTDSISAIDLEIFELHETLEYYGVELSYKYEEEGGYIYKHHPRVYIEDCYRKIRWAKNAGTIPDHE